MKKVITYGTYDLLHKGHVRLLERAKALGDYLIVGVTADTFDRERGKINVQQSLVERIENVKSTGLADEIVIEEYEGQKIDDIKRMNVDIFTVGSDWRGKFDYLSEYCEVVYLERTKGISSTELRSDLREIRIGLVGESSIITKFARESKYVNGINISGVYTENDHKLGNLREMVPFFADNYAALLEVSDAVYIISHPEKHYTHIKEALLHGKHVLCESPISLNNEGWKELNSIADEQGLILMDSIKTAYSMAYDRLCLLAKSGKIGKIYSIDATCTSLSHYDTENKEALRYTWNSFCAWAPTALLPILQLLGTDYTDKTICTHLIDDAPNFDTFTKISFIYPHAVASLKVGQGIKSEGELVISGTEGYIYVPAPWWKTDYFEVRRENQSDNKRYFYQLDGEGIRYELLTFIKSIQIQRNLSYVSKDVSEAIASITADFYQRKDTVLI